MLCMARRVKARDGFHREVRRQQANLEASVHKKARACNKYKSVLKKIIGQNGKTLPLIRLLKNTKKLNQGMLLQ